MANAKYVDKQAVLDLIISKISNMTYLANPEIPSEIQDTVQSNLSDLQYDIEQLTAIEASEDCVDRGEVLNVCFPFCPDDDGSCSKADIDPREMLDAIEGLPNACPTIPEAEWVFRRTIKNGLDTAMPPICTNCKFTDANASRHAFCPNCGYKMKPPRFVGYLKGIE